jgi:serine protease SohB
MRAAPRRRHLNLRRVHLQALIDYGLFLAKAVTIAVAIIFVVAAILSLRHRRHPAPEGTIEVTDLGERFERFEEELRNAVMDEDELKAWHKAERKREKSERKERLRQQKAGKESPPQRRLFVLDFDGDVQASGVDNLREEISAVLTLATADDEVLVRLESSGGMVHSYGLAASQLQRIRNAGLPLTVAVDAVAASGGYMMACVAQTIIAAPFAIIGSIGVMAQLPNFHRLLKKHDIDVELHTAGEFKRTLTVFGENTEKGRRKFLEELEETHQLFKQFVSENRPQVDIDHIATGEIWYGTQALQKGLVDAVQTSDEYLMSLREERDLFQVRYVEKRSWQERLGLAAEGSLDRVLLRWWERLGRRRFW